MDVQIATFFDSRGIERTMEMSLVTGNAKMLKPDRSPLVTLSGSRVVRDPASDHVYLLHADDTFEDEFGNTWTLKH